MENFLWFIILSLAVWRVSNLFVAEAGPFDIFRKIRTTVEEFYFIASGKKKGLRWTLAKFLYGVISCVWCLSLWVSLGAALLSKYSVDFVSYVVTAFAISSVSCILESLISFLDKDKR